MATKDNSTIQSDAFELLDCFEGGLGDVLYQIAESIAGNRTQNENIEITVADVTQAAAILIEALEKSNLPPDARQWLKTMHEKMISAAHHGRKK